MEIKDTPQQMTVHKFKQGKFELWLKELTLDDERMVARRCIGNPSDVVFEQLFQAAVKVNGVPCSIADGSAEREIKKLDAKQRIMAVQAYNRVHGAKQAEVEDFLATATVEVS